MISKLLKKQVTFTGRTPVLFDRYVSNEAKLSPEKKLYLEKDVVGLPAINIMSLIAATNTESAPKLFYDVRKYKTMASAILSSTVVTPHFIPFERDGKPIRFGAFDENEVDPKSGITIMRSVARLEKGVPNPKVRPMLGLPWQLRFTMDIIPHKLLNEDDLEDLFTFAGLGIGIGTFRKVFGKFDFSWK